MNHNIQENIKNQEEIQTMNHNVQENIKNQLKKTTNNMDFNAQYWINYFQNIKNHGNKIKELQVMNKSKSMDDLNNKN